MKVILALAAALLATGAVAQTVPSTPDQTSSGVPGGVRPDGADPTNVQSTAGTRSTEHVRMSTRHMRAHSVMRSSNRGGRHATRHHAKRHHKMHHRHHMTKHHGASHHTTMTSHHHRGTTGTTTSTTSH